MKYFYHNEFEIFDYENEDFWWEKVKCLIFNEFYKANIISGKEFSIHVQVFT